MHEVATFIGECLASGIMLSSLCAVVIVPLIAWLGVRIAAPLIARMGADPIWQSPLAALAAILPGALFLTLAAVGIGGGIQSTCLRFAGGRLIFGVLASLVAFGVSRAIVLAFQRLAHARALLAASYEPSDRLSRIAERCGLAVRECADNRPLCLLVNVIRPIAIVSMGTLARLSDVELEAALLHERAHAASGDQQLALALSFFIDVLPLPADDLIAIHHRARELAADRRALGGTCVDHLASALLNLSKSVRTVPATAGFADHALHARLDALLRSTPERFPRKFYRIAVCGLLAFIVLGGIAPIIFSVVADNCMKTMSRNG